MKTGRFGGQPERSVFSVWVLTGFACCSASKSRSTHAVFRGCLKTIFRNRSRRPLLSKAINLSYALLPWGAELFWGMGWRRAVLKTVCSSFKVKSQALFSPTAMV